MFFYRIFLLFSLCTVVLADHKSQSNQVYNRSSELTVENINKAVKVIRDPTQMSGNFRQALNSFKPISSASGATNEAVVPAIKLIGKIYFPRPPVSYIQNSQSLSSVALEINNETIHLKEGSMTSIIKDEHIISISVEEITKQYVKLKIQPSNETLILH